MDSTILTVADAKKYAPQIKSFYDTYKQQKESNPNSARSSLIKDAVDAALTNSLTSEEQQHQQNLQVAMQQGQAEYTKNHPVSVLKSTNDKWDADSGSGVNTISDAQKKSIDDAVEKYQSEHSEDGGNWGPVSDFFSGVSNFVKDVASDPGNLARILFGEGGYLDPNQMPLIGSTDEDNAIAQEKANYRAEHPMESDAFKEGTYEQDYEGKAFRGITSDKWRKVYEDYFDSQGGLDSGYQSAYSYFLDPGSQEEGKQDVSVLMDKLAGETYDDGTNTLENRKAINMSGAEYLNYREAGIPGRPIEDIIANGLDATYNKYDEMADYNFIPYIVDEDQAKLWDGLRIANTGSKFFTKLGNIREDWTDPTVNYNGQNISYDQLYSNMGDYYNGLTNKMEEETAGMSDEEKQKYQESFIVKTSDRNDPRVVEGASPIRLKYQIDLGDGEVDEVYTSSDPIFQEVYDDSGNVVIQMSWPDVDDVYYLDNEDDLANVSLLYDEVDNDEDANAFYNVDPMQYTQYDGAQVTIPYTDVKKLQNNANTQEFDVDYGPLNIAKPSGELSNLTDWKFEDWIPSLIDITAGSAPLFVPQTAWPMALSNAGSAVSGLDANSYDPDTGTWRMVSASTDENGNPVNDITADQYGLNIGLSALVPLTEKFAGNLGAGRGLMGKPIDAAFRRYDINPMLKYPTDWILGEGSEEAIAGAWEGLQQDGFDEAFGNQLYQTDENGEVKLDAQGEPVPLYDASGHLIKDTNTSLSDRVNNYLATIPENFVAGSLLGSSLGSLGLASDIANNSGSYQEARNRKAEIAAEQALGLPRFRSVKRGNNEYTINPEVLEAYRR